MIDPDFVDLVRKSVPVSVRMDPAVVGEAAMFVRREPEQRGPRKQPTEHMVLAVHDGEVMGDTQYIPLSNYIAAGRFERPV